MPVEGYFALPPGLFQESFPAENNEPTGITSCSEFLICNKCWCICTDQKLYEDHVRECQCERENEDVGAIEAEAVRIPMFIPLFPTQSSTRVDPGLVAPPPVSHPILLNIQDPAIYGSILKFIECERCLESFLGQQKYDDHLSKCGAAWRVTNEEQRNVTGTASRNESAQPGTRQCIQQAIRYNLKRVLSQPRNRFFDDQSNRSRDPGHFSTKCSFCSKNYKSVASKRKHELRVHKFYRRKNINAGPNNGTPGVSFKPVHEKRVRGNSSSSGGASPAAPSTSATITQHYMQQPTSGPQAKHHSTSVVASNGGADQCTSTSMPIVTTSILNGLPPHPAAQQPLTPLPNVNAGVNWAAQNENRYPNQMPPFMSLRDGLGLGFSGSFNLAEPTQQQPTARNLMFLNERQRNLPATARSASLQRFQEDHPDQAAF